MAAHVTINQVLNKKKIKAQHQAYEKWLGLPRKSYRCIDVFKALLDPLVLPVWALLIFSGLLYGLDMSVFY